MMRWAVNKAGACHPIGQCTDGFTLKVDRIISKLFLE